MRVLHIDTGAEMRGGQRQVMLLLDGLRAAGHHSLLLARKNSPLWGAAKIAGFDVGAARLTQLWRQSISADIVHAHDARAHTMAAIACRGKFVVSRRVAFPVRRSLLSAWKYSRPAGFLAVSRFVAGKLEAAGIHREKIDTVYDGVTVTPLVCNWSPEFPVVAPATLDPAKGRDLVEQAAHLTGIDVRFSENLAEHLCRASLFLYITRSEGFGSAVLLAMSMGVPVIASAVGGLLEIFSDGVSGIYVENDPQAIAEAMQNLLGQPTLVKEMVRKARARIEDCFTQAHLIQRTLRAYQRALAA